MAIIHMLVEGVMHEAAANCLIKKAGHTPGTCFREEDYTKLQAKAREFNQTSAGAIYLVLVDFIDTGHACPANVDPQFWFMYPRFVCPAEVVSEWVPDRQPHLLFRVVVRELESWLFADRENLADFLHLKAYKLPDPHKAELPVHPKVTMLALASRSRSKRMREALVDNPGSANLIEGRLYTSEMVRFIQKHWDIENARRNSESLDKCCARLEEIAK